MNPFTALPPKARAGIYYGTFAVGIVLGAIQLAYDTAHIGLPLWLVIALKVLPFLVAGFGITAASNTVTKARRALVVEPVQIQPEAAQAVADAVEKRLRDPKTGRFRSPAERA